MAMSVSPVCMYVTCRCVCLLMVGHTHSSELSRHVVHTNLWLIIEQQLQYHHYHHQRLRCHVSPPIICRVAISQCVSATTHMYVMMILHLTWTWIITSSCLLRAYALVPASVDAAPETWGTRRNKCVRTYWFLTSKIDIPMWWMMILRGKRFCNAYLQWQKPKLAEEDA